MCNSTSSKQECMHTHTYTRTHTHKQMCIPMSTHVYTICMHAFIHINITCACSCVHTYTRTFTSVQICIFPYVHMYTQMCECNLHMFTCSIINTCEHIHTIGENKYRLPCMHIHPCMPRAHIHTCSQIHSHIYIYTYI